MQATMLDQPTLEEIVETVWSTMLQMPIRCLGDWCGADRLDASGVEAADGQVPLTGCVHIAGVWNGSVLIFPTETFARRAAATMLGISAIDAVEADLQDAVAEISNIVAGGVKSIVPGPSSLSLPTVTYGSHYGLRIRGSQTIADLAFECGGQRLRLRVVEAQPSIPE